jgi:hypothetical protein
MSENQALGTALQLPEMSFDDIKSVKGIGWPCGRTQQPYGSAYSIVGIVITSIVTAHLILEYQLVVQQRNVPGTAVSYRESSRAHQEPECNGSPVHHTDILDT